jgi:hypothetical protein
MLYPLTHLWSSMIVRPTLEFEKKDYWRWTAIIDAQLFSNSFEGVHLVVRKCERSPIYVFLSLHLWISFLKSFKGVHEILLPLSPPRVHLCKTFTIRKNFHDVKMCFLFLILFKRFYLLFCRGMLLNPHLFTPIHTRPLWTSLFWFVSRNHEKLKESLLNS